MEVNTVIRALGELERTQTALAPRMSSAMTPLSRRWRNEIFWLARPLFQCSNVELLYCSILQPYKSPVLLASVARPRVELRALLIRTSPFFLRPLPA